MKDYTLKELRTIEEAYLHLYESIPSWDSIDNDSFNFPNGDKTLVELIDSTGNPIFDYVGRSRAIIGGYEIKNVCPLLSFLRCRDNEKFSEHLSEYDTYSFSKRCSALNDYDIMHGNPICINVLEDGMISEFNIRYNKDKSIVFYPITETARKRGLNAIISEISKFLNALGMKESSTKMSNMTKSELNRLMADLNGIGCSLVKDEDYYHYRNVYDKEYGNATDDNEILAIKKKFGKWKRLANDSVVRLKNIGLISDSHIEDYVYTMTLNELTDLNDLTMRWNDSFEIAKKHLGDKVILNYLSKIDEIKKLIGVEDTKELDQLMNKYIYGMLTK